MGTKLNTLAVLSLCFACIVWGGVFGISLVEPKVIEIEIEPVRDYGLETQWITCGELMNDFEYYFNQSVDSYDKWKMCSDIIIGSDFDWNGEWEFDEPVECVDCDKI